MGVRKRESAERRKEQKSLIAISTLNNCPTSPRKMRMVAELIRGKEVDLAVSILKFNQKAPAKRLEKVLLSAINNWQQKNKDERIEEHELFVKTVFVDSARQLKRLRPAPQGRGNKIRKRSNHVTIVLASKNAPEVVIEQEEEDNNQENN
ncbi:MAG: 50S ribosomal protein L22 [Bacteroidota bacterium]